MQIQVLIAKATVSFRMNGSRMISIRMLRNYFCSENYTYSMSIFVYLHLHTKKYFPLDLSHASLQVPEINIEETEN